MGGERGGGEWGGETVLNNIFKNGFIFLKCTDCRDFFSKIVLIVRIFKKMYGLYGFFQKSFGHPANITFPSGFDGPKIP